MAPHKCNQEERIASLDKTLSLSINTIQGDIKYIRELVDAIHTQTQKTNGRVNKLESFRTLISGAWLVVSAVIIASWGILSAIIIKSITK